MELTFTCTVGAPQYLAKFTHGHWQCSSCPDQNGDSQFSLDNSKTDNTGSAHRSLLWEQFCLVSTPVFYYKVMTSRSPSSLALPPSWVRVLAISEVSLSFSHTLEPTFHIDVSLSYKPWNVGHLFVSIRKQHALFWDHTSFHVEM